LRVGITDWAGFAGGIFANHGFHTAKTERTRFRFPVEFVNIEGLRESEKALSEPCGVDVLWSSVEAWACEFPRLLKNKIRARAIMQVASSRGAHVLVVDSTTRDLRDLRPGKLATPRFTPEHWLVEQIVPNADSIALVDSPEEALQKFLRTQADAVALCEPYVHRALAGRADARRFLELDGNTDVPYILVARDSAIEQHDRLKDFIQTWLDGNQDALSSPDIVVQLLEEKRDGGSSDPAILDDEKKAAADRAILDELRHVRFAGVAENLRLFGLDGKRPEFDNIFDKASQRWMSREFVDPARAADAKYDRFLQEIYAARASVPALRALCADKAVVTVTDQITINFDPPGNSEIRDQYGSALDRIVTVLRAHPSTQACIEGYTDSTGTEKRNALLSLDRAGAVADYLRKRGVGQNRVVPAGKGQTSPVASNSTLEGQAANRRAMVRVVMEGEE
jgi:outer membrane protein OmpA-like peptidoglycan-associated protein